jgi:hypothetical protein
MTCSFTSPDSTPKMDNFCLKRFFKNSYDKYMRVSVYPIIVENNLRSEFKQTNAFLVCVESFKPQYLVSTDPYEDALEAIFAWRDMCEKVKEPELMDPMCQTWEITKQEFEDEFPVLLEKTAIRASSAVAKN